jgi:hypothetical protein
MTLDEAYNRRRVMVNLVEANRHIEEARSLIGDCHINRLPPLDPVAMRCNLLWNVLYADNVATISGGDCLLFNLLQLAAEVAQGATAVEGPAKVQT